jgi:hypothetical protein
VFGSCLSEVNFKGAAGKGPSDFLPYTPSSCVLFAESGTKKWRLGKTGPCVRSKRVTFRVQSRCPFWCIIIRGNIRIDLRGVFWYSVWYEIVLVSAECSSASWTCFLMLVSILKIWPIMAGKDGGSWLISEVSI